MVLKGVVDDCVVSMSRELFVLAVFTAFVVEVTSTPGIVLLAELYFSFAEPSRELESLPNSSAPNWTSRNPIPLLTASPGISTAVDGIFDGGGTRGRCFVGL